MGNVLSYSELCNESSLGSTHDQAKTWVVKALSRVKDYAEVNQHQKETVSSLTEEQLKDMQQSATDLSVRDLSDTQGQLGNKQGLAVGSRAKDCLPDQLEGKQDQVNNILDNVQFQLEAKQRLAKVLSAGKWALID